MPWRKRWIDPREFEGREEDLGDVLAKRAYEVWVSEVMLQQTRVSTVIPYFNKWISTWPTVQDLADANHDDVLSVWKGLGYYSRATRLHDGAKAMIANKSTGSSCLIPSSATDLQQFPGIGRYTAGAISSIAFGEAEPVLDGNVARVLSRQLGLYMDAKEKRASDILWEQADQLIKRVSTYADTSTSAVPGQWNQALMELGSTICTPRPRCEECPIQDTCRVYSEGQALSDKRESTTVIDIEDACSLCGPVDTEDVAIAPEEDSREETSRATKKRKTGAKQANTISHYFAVGTPKSNAETEEDEDSGDYPPSDEHRKRKTPTSAANSKSIAAYCSLFPKKSAKKKVAEEECFPQCTLSGSQTTPRDRKASAQGFISRLDIGNVQMSKAHYVASFPPLVHVFTHLKLTMHAYRYKITADKAEDVDLVCNGPLARRWTDTESMDGATLSTGMRKCWELIANTL
ncbi:DNA glycosylase [Cucurbitaria berberidis CBS 394.84]|uniref:Adenine DNA glycosylase n=1 Tax=Cucurbitaria berberidis CBS 394.84 TaxID=1168544 RepID=A0A9P4GPU7_9PLEO|nr:DNA glycosylase [Cucurbitaria berberidis CBS 394.84]KAF1850473.1 DNA glycosylase [Cucurbitaria berberidis CBS 394.84]